MQLRADHQFRYWHLYQVILVPFLMQMPNHLDHWTPSFELQITRDRTYEPHFFQQPCDALHLDHLRNGVFFD